MQILPNRYYWVIMRHGDWEKRGRCIHLRLKEMAPEEKTGYEGTREQNELPTHQVVFYDFEVYRVLEGKIKKETEDALVLELGKGKEYEFRPF
ncbi:MAG: hypothetical protein MJA84_00060 [Firmicutes bacterium]|nr:hypothetical protein [Bacillota bacterium]